MLSLSEPDASGWKTLKINSSSLDLLLTCKRKAYNKLVLGLDPKFEAAALGFGTAIHKFVEHKLSLPTASRSLPDDAKTRHKLEAYAALHELDEEETGTLESIRQFALTCHKHNIVLDDTDKRSVHNGIKICKAYIKQYANDNMIVYSDSEGPYLERKFEMPLFDLESEKIHVVGFGTIDAILQNEQTKTIFVADHKTTAALGSEFFNRLKPNHQYTMYVLAAQKCFHIQSSTFMINGIQVAKTKQEFARQFTDRTEEDFENLYSSLRIEIRSWLNCLDTNEFSMNSPNACSMYGGCTYLDVCSVPKIIQASVIKSKFKE